MNEYTVRMLTALVKCLMKAFPHSNKCALWSFAQTPLCFVGKVILEAANVTKCSVGCFIGLAIRRSFGASPWRSDLVMTGKFIFLLGVSVIFHFNLFSD